jgi:hypothetical protein
MSNPCEVTATPGETQIGGLLAFHDHTDPGWPDVRWVEDEHACRLGWKRIAQAGLLGVFRT